MSTTERTIPGIEDSLTQQARPMSPEEARRIYDERLAREHAAYDRGEETNEDRRLNDAREGRSENSPNGIVLRVRDRSGALCWPPFHDPRPESAWMRECGREMPQEDEPMPEQYDAHVQAHKRLLIALGEFDEVLRKAWMHLTGQVESVIEVPKGDRADMASDDDIPSVDRNKAAYDYLLTTHNWRDEMRTIVLAIGDGCMSRRAWGIRQPEWKYAHRIWNRFALSLAKRLERQPFHLYVFDLEKTAAYSPRPNDLREEATRLAEIDAKYSRRY